MGYQRVSLEERFQKPTSHAQVNESFSQKRETNKTKAQGRTVRSQQGRDSESWRLSERPHSTSTSSQAQGHPINTRACIHIGFWTISRTFPLNLLQAILTVYTADILTADLDLLTLFPCPIRPSLASQLTLLGNREGGSPVSLACSTGRTAAAPTVDPGSWNPGLERVPTHQLPQVLSG